MAQPLVRGNLVRWMNGTDAIGVVQQTLLNGKRVDVLFDDGEKHQFPSEGEALEHVRFTEGMNVVIVGSEQLFGSVVAANEHSGRLSYQVRTVSGETKTSLEDSVRPAVIDSPVELLRTGEPDSTRSTNLRLAATRLAFANEFDDLSSLSNSRVEIKPHQVGVVHRVMSSWPHRFILADEVGLGKTIEAGLIIKELKARGLAKRVLILAPSGLLHQWQFEMKTKFNETFARIDSGVLKYLRGKNEGENPWTIEDDVVVSTSFATWDKDRRREIALAGWDLVVIDEAHHARSRRTGENKYETTKLYRLAEELNDPELGGASGCLLLTATPMQLDRYELYAMIELLDPVLFPSYEDFDQHIDELSGLNDLVEKLKRWESLAPAEKDRLGTEVEALGIELEADFEESAKTPDGRDAIQEELISRHHLSDVMVRNRKTVVGGFQPRVATTWNVDLTEHERAVYETVTEYVKTGYDKANRERVAAIGFLMTTFQKLLSSSSRALRSTMSKRIEKLRDEVEASTASVPEDEQMEETPAEVALEKLLAVSAQKAVEDECKELERMVAMLDEIEVDSKALELRDRLAGDILEHDPDAKVIIFTQFRNTQDYLESILKDKPWKVHLFHGGLKPQEKDAAVEAFRLGSGPQLLITTEAGGEGRNFQFCHMLVNYDLPWNPMKVEQRIGRVDRIGQKHPVKIFNLSAKDTVEARVVEVLSKRIKIFEQTVGGLDPILGSVETDLKQMLALADERQQARLEEYERQLEARVHEARQAEIRRADFIMDTRSYRQDEVDRLLDRRGETSNDDLRAFILGTLAELRCPVSRDQTLDDVYVLKLSGEFADLFPQYAREGRERRIAFDPSVALDYETVEFYAFGHEIVDALVARARSKEYKARASVRRIYTDELPAVRGWFFVYTIELDGIVSRRELFPLFIGSDGEARSDLADSLLELSAKGGKEEFTKAYLPSDMSDFDDAVAEAENAAVGRLMDQQMEMSDVNRRRLEQERAKLERFYDYKEDAAQQKLERTRETFERLSTDEDPAVQRILPVWKKRLHDSRDLVDRVADEKEERLGGLIGREHVNASHTLLSASYVEVWPDPATLGGPQLEHSAARKLRDLCQDTTAEEFEEITVSVKRRKAVLGKLIEKHDFDLDTAEKCADRLIGLCEGAGNLDAAGRFLLRGAVEYYLEIADDSHDINEEAGFDDDLRVIQAVEAKLEGRADDSVGSPASDSDADLDLVDSRCRPLLEAAIENGAPAPVIGLELGDGEYLLEVAWPDAKVAILTDSQSAPESWEARVHSDWDSSDLIQALDQAPAKVA